MATKTSREQVVAVLDGNVLMMQVPQNAASFAAYTGIVTNAIRQAMGSAALVVVVFDDPKHMTEAKREEQMRRDAARKKVEPVCSRDLVPYPTTDDYGIAELTATSDCHAIVKCRSARQRFFDETGRQVLLNLRRSITAWAEGGHESVVIFDGLDPRGAARAGGEKRDAQIYGSDAEVAALFQREHAIGEGDLKLAWVEQRVRDLVAADKLDAKLHMSITIDTDSIAIELMEQARRNCEPAPERDVMGVLCMRERAQKRGEYDEDARAVYWAVDYGQLFEMLQKHMWGLTYNPTPHEQRMAMSLMTSGWALAGCDFVRVPGLNARMVFDAMPSYLKTAKELLALMPDAWSHDRTKVRHILPALRRLLMLCANNYDDEPRSRKTAVASMREHTEDQLLRAAWTAAYWNQHEIAGTLDEFGFMACLTTGVASSSDALVAPPKPPPSVVSRFFAAAARPEDRIEDHIEDCIEGSAAAVQIQALAWVGPK